MHHTPGREDSHAPADPREDRLGEETYQEYADRLRLFAERHISSKWGGLIQAEDVAMSALGSFYRRFNEGRYTIDHSGAL